MRTAASPARDDSTSRPFATATLPARVAVSIARINGSFIQALMSENFTLVKLHRQTEVCRTVETTVMARPRLMRGKSLTGRSYSFLILRPDHPASETAICRVAFAE